MRALLNRKVNGIPAPSIQFVACVPKYKWFGIGFNGTKPYTAELLFFIAK